MQSISHILAGFTRKKFVLLAAIAVLFVSCGYSPCACDGDGTLPVLTTPSPGLGFDVAATESDHTVSMHVGQKLEVVLHAPNGMNNWTHPESHDTSVLSPIVDPAATAARGVTLAAFEAKKAGQAEITSNASPSCSPGQACPMYLAVYSLKVTVTP
jgi:hypothetical protein